MKCASCYTDNVNEAKYCRNCGRNMRDARLNETKGKGITFSVVVICLGLVIASIIICLRKTGNLLASTSINSDSFSEYASDTLIYADGSDKVKVWYNDEGTEKSKTYDVQGEIKKIDEGVGCAVVKTSSGYYFIDSKECSKMSGCTRYILSERTANAAFSDGRGHLYKCSASGVKLVSDDVMDFAVSGGGDVYYLKNTTAPSDPDATVYEENSFYMEAKYMCAEDPEDPCGKMLCANDFGFYYVTESGMLYVVDNAKDKENKFATEDFAELITVGRESILITKTDGKTYALDKSNEETELCDLPVSEMILPYGYRFSGDKYTEIMYGVDEDGDKEFDFAVYVFDDETRSEKIGEGKERFAVSGDCSYLFCTDSNGDLWRYDAKGAHEPKRCGENVSEYLISPDGKKAWLISENKLCLFDGLSCTELCDVTGLQEFSITRFGTPVLRIKTTGDSGKTKKTTALYVYTDELTEILGNVKKVEFCGKTRRDWCYVDAKGIHRVCEDGSFKTAKELEAAESDSVQPSGSAES